MTDVRVQNPEPLNPEPRTQNLEVRRQRSVQVSGFRCQVSEVRREKKRSLEVKKLRGWEGEKVRR